MSTGVATAGGPIRSASSHATGLAVAHVQALTTPVRAFAASRIVVLAAGVAGTLTATKHDPAAAQALAYRLGPVGYALSGSVDRFDSGYYLSIAGHGYGTVASGKLAFFPLYPFLIRLLTVVTRSGVIAGVVISVASFLAALIMLHRLTESELGRRAADATVLVLAFAPLSFFFTAVYTESLFLMLSVATALAARRGRWRLACGLGALATLSRPTGLLLVIVLVVMRIRTQGGLERGLAWVLALPATLLGYLALLAANGYPWLGVFTAQAGWRRVTTGPLIGVSSAVWAAIRGVGEIAGGAAIYHPTLRGPLTQGAESILLLIIVAIACAAVVACLRRLPLEYGAYAAAVILMCLSTPEVGQPLWSFDRFTLTIFPLWMAAGVWVARRRLEVPAVLLGTLALVFYTLQFSGWAFVA